MKIAIITGSRSDQNALEMVRRALVETHEVVWCDLSTAGDKQPAGWGMRWRDWAPVRRTEFAVGNACWHLWQPERPPFDLVILHGDRHEVLGAAVAANTMGLPIAHIGGGDITNGSQDDCYRHAITKLSHLHFATNADSGERIVQMGEQRSRVHVVGDPGIDMVKSTGLLSREDTLMSVGLKFSGPFILVSFHPNTLGDTQVELDALYGALEQRGEGIVFIGPNADAGADLIRERWGRFIGQWDRRPIDAEVRVSYRMVFCDNLSPQVFYSLMNHCAVMIGNSSAGFYEAPCFSTPVINLGDRQNGRAKPNNVIDVESDRMLRADISQALQYVLDNTGMLWTNPLPKIRNLYGDGQSAARIAKVIDSLTDPKSLLRKRFNDQTEHISGELLDIF